MAGASTSSFRTPNRAPGTRSKFAWCTDESHIIRTIEYWDVEKKRYPQYDHYAVMVAEDITSRFLNSWASSTASYPLIALQMSALKFGDQMSLVFTKVLDALSLGMPDDDEDVQAVTDRDYWETRGTKETVALADEMFEDGQHLRPRTSNSSTTSST